MTSLDTNPNPEITQKAPPSGAVRHNVLLHWLLFIGGTAAMIGIGALIQH